MTTAILLLLVGILAIALIIAANGYFVAQEFAYMSVDRLRLAAEAEGGDDAAERALRVTRRTSFMLSGAQLGITVTGLLVGYVAEPLVGRGLAVILGGTGVPEALSLTVGTVSALAIATVVQMIFGELYPKNLAIANSGPLARTLARSTLIYLAVFGWLIKVFDWSANALLRLVRIEPIHDLDTTATAEELERIVAESRDSGDLPAELSVLLDRILDFPDQDVEHAQVPRSRVDVISPDTPVEELRQLMAEGHTRYPVIDDQGQPVGVVNLVDLLRQPDAEHAGQIMREPLIVPTLMALPDAVSELSSSGQQLACVVDEYGGFAGVLTMEDLAEELLGEITDEHDDEVPEGIVAEDEHLWRTDGDVHVDELQRALGHDLPEGDYETVSGLVIAELGALPEVGQTVVVDLAEAPAEMVLEERVSRSVEIEVREIDRHVPSLLGVRLVERALAQDPEPEDDAEDGTDAATRTETDTDAATEEDQR
ncbi:Magnesium and cobalt efflux protein CorC [Serinicoccus hydrothermalis]|uniref:Magnesium and cobalt efflux protein CorC n=1 Tax=Serinicoccus hydrothermalis TaxID=1758689 RepID=A0A1B1NAW6_9MICO|nr:hemolysin family protein [Serinicoccus hydrothermalis]ANS78576.1 Magnesium and cobalt efflux protein CorC [Serinicoccus hydrothermalis]